MKESLISNFISEKRLSSYKNLHEYKNNLIFSKDSYIPLSILEIALRNAINYHLTIKIGKDWLEDERFMTKDSLVKVNQTKNLLYRRGEEISKEKLLAELSLGFWVNLFKKPYEKKLRINDIKKIFPNLPSQSVKFINRNVIYQELNHIRNFRNRVFHYEKVINKDNYNNIFTEIYEVLNYFDGEIANFAKVSNEKW